MMKSIEDKRAYWREQYWTHREEINARRRGRQGEYYRQWYQINGRDRANDYAIKIEEYRKEHQSEVNVRAQFLYYVNSGVIKRSECCSLCGRSGRISAHHPDYDKPFEVIWCCSSCHKKIHFGTIAVDKERVEQYNITRHTTQGDIRQDRLEVLY